MMNAQEQHRGSIRWRGGRADVRLSLGAPHGRRTFLLPHTLTREQAEERVGALARLAARLRAAGRVALALPLLARLATVEGPRDAKVTTEAIEAVLAGDTVVLPTGETTFGELAQRWTSGELTRLYPDHVRPKSTAGKDAQRFESYLLEPIGPVPLASFTLDHAQYAMRQLPADLAPATRRQIAQIIRRVLALAVFPVRAIKENPIPRGFLPHTGERKAMTYVYPSEDRALLGRTATALPFRIFYGFLDREGMRAGEAEALEWPDVDLENGVVTLAENKTDDPRAWALRPDVVRALRAWRALREARGDRGARVFVNDAGAPLHVASKHLRAHLHAAGIERSALFDRSKTRQPIRRHDLRATFITIALANGKTEAWIADRTGHKSSLMINRYRRTARNAAELGLGDLAPLDLAIPELAPSAAAAEERTTAETEPRPHGPRERWSRRGPRRRGPSRRDLGRVRKAGEGSVSRPTETQIPL